MTTNTPIPIPQPGLVPMCRVACEVGSLLVLGQAPAGQRRCVPLTGGRVEGPEFTGEVVAGGIDWQWQQADGTLEIDAHYVLRADADGGLVEVRSTGLRHGPPEVMARLARGEAVDPADYFFRTCVRFTTGAPAWLHLNRVMAIASGRREATRVLLDLWRVT
jgi:Protein of unknown function (DUF3237)